MIICFSMGQIMMKESMEHNGYSTKKVEFASSLGLHIQARI